MKWVIHIESQDWIQKLTAVIAHFDATVLKSQSAGEGGMPERLESCLLDEVG